MLIAKRLVLALTMASCLAQPDISGIHPLITQIIKYLEIFYDVLELRLNGL
jgi:hypothetical protein